MSRAEWCISRQRSWGVPIPMLHDENSEPVVSSQAITHIIAVLSEKGTDHWWTGPIEDFISPAQQSGVFTKGRDTLDVWFDSGSSWTLLEEGRLRSASLPLADVYLEGSDQHRGWFQSSLLTRLCAADTAPYGTLITHGFVLDEEGQKMSKSAGNGMSPMDIIHGTTVRSCRRPLFADFP
jgi:isoleucyl-tRNA synthetase